MNDPANGHPATPSPTEPVTVAAVDLGSNSFHMLIAQATDSDIQIIDRLRETVRLGAGLTKENRLSAAAHARAIVCLERFGQRLRALAPQHVRAVGTNTLRLARHDERFGTDARRALGHAIEVISGLEEARLIYKGVANMHYAEERRLVVDIGGGSTELIIGENHDVLLAHSLYMGCISLSRTFFPKGRITRDAFRDAQTAAGQELEGIRVRLRKAGWQSTMGASGTIGAISEILRANAWTSGEIDLPALKKLRRELVGAGDTHSLQLAGLRPDRAAVLPGGLAILIAVFKSLEITSMERSLGALREGVLYDLFGRIRHQDVRDATIQRFMERYKVDADQAQRLERSSLELLEQISDAELTRMEAPRVLGWAARLHEIGLALRYAGYHKHGAYLVTNSDMPGFSTDDQALLAAIIGSHRRDISRALLLEVPPRRQDHALHLIVLFRLAALLNRGRTALPTPRLHVQGDWEALHVLFPAGWLAEHPLTAADLEGEASVLGEAGIALVVEESGATVA